MINLPVSTWKDYFRLLMEKNRMHLSIVPPPEAKIEGLPGHQPMALTAAVCSWNLIS